MPDQQSLFNELFEMISNNNDQQEIVKKLDSLSNEDKDIVNIVKENGYDETMLMWAVWHQMNQVIEKLLELGANPNFTNWDGEGLSTYWSENAGEDQELAAEIVIILHNKGVDLSRNSENSWSIVKRANEYNWTILKENLIELGY